LAWEVGFPLLLPTFMVLLVVSVSFLGPRPARLHWDTLELAPWTFCFFALTLIGSTLRRTRPNHSRKKVVLASLWLIAGVTAYVASQVVLWRQDAHYLPAASVWIVSGLLCLISTGLCYELEK
jgi:cation transport ATPase